MDNHLHLRDLSNFERAILDKMLTYNFGSKTQLLDQVNNAKVNDSNRNDEYGSVDLTTSSRIKSLGSTRVPIELEAKDSDGIEIAALLHVVDGFIDELEFYKADGSSIKKMPPAEQFERKAWDQT